MENKIKEAAKQYCKDRHKEEYDDPIYNPDVQTSNEGFKAGANWAMKIYNETTTSTGTVFANTPKDNKALEELKDLYYKTAITGDLQNSTDLIDIDAVWNFIETQVLPHLQTKQADENGMDKEQIMHAIAHSYKNTSEGFLIDHNILTDKILKLCPKSEPVVDTQELREKFIRLYMNDAFKFEKVSATDPNNIFDWFLRIIKEKEESDSVEFAEWSGDDNGEWTFMKHLNSWYNYNTKENITTKELYQLFKSQPPINK